jgi:sugar O-acyltransferase (sialic acid O-acetyltransferase NeuD family)
MSSEPRMIILGAGGLAIQVLDVAERLGFEGKLTFFDNVNKYPEDPKLVGYPILRTVEEVKKTVQASNCLLVSGIAKPATRKAIHQLFKTEGLSFHTLVAKSAVMGRHEVVIGDGTVILENVSIESTAKIGKGCLLNTGCRLFHGVQTGDFCEIAPGALLLGNVHIGNEVFIGANAIILPGVHIGDQAVIGAGTVVTKNVPAGVLLKGVAGK